MVFKELEVKKDETADDAQAIVKRAMRYNSEITIEHGFNKVNAKSLMGVIAMALKRGDSVVAIAKGDDQEEALEDLSKLFERFFKV